MDACNKKVDLHKILFWPFSGGKQGEYFFHFFGNTLYFLPIVHWLDSTKVFQYFKKYRVKQVKFGGCFFLSQSESETSLIE